MQTEQKLTQRTEQESVKEIVRAMAELSVVPAHDGSLATITGAMAVFDEWAGVDSVYEGTFVEKVARGSFLGAFSRNEGQPLFEHGQDPSIGRKPLGEVIETGENERSAFYRFALFDTDYARSLLPALETGKLGSSFRGDATIDVTRFVERSDYNPKALDEHVVIEVTRLKDYGPCVFPVYAGTTSAVTRSMTDEFIFAQLSHGEGLKRLAEYVQRARPIEIKATEQSAAEETPPAAEATPAKPVTRTEKEKPVEALPAREFERPEDVAARRSEVVERQAQLGKEYPAGGMPEEVRTEWDQLKTELPELDKRLAEVEEINRTIQEAEGQPGRTEQGYQPQQFQVRKSTQRDIYDPVARRNEARSREEEKSLARSDAMKAIEGARFPHPNVRREDAQGIVEDLMRDDGTGETAERILATGSPAYQRAFAKVCRGSLIFSSQEQAALERAAFTLGTTGMPVVWTLDPTVIRTSNYVINPLRQISRVETITGTNEWRGVTSGAVVATYEAEATEAADQTPTLTQPAVQVQRAQTFVPFSREVDQDWGRVQTEMAGLFQESKDILEATQFLTGAGTTVFPQGVLTGLTTTQRVQSGTTGVFAEADLLALQNALPPRARTAEATFLASLTQFNRIRALDTGGGNALWSRLADGTPTSLLGMRNYELSTMTTTLAGAGNKIMLVGDFSKGFLIVDRIGMDIELIPHLFGAANRYPTGQRGLWAMWRNSSKVLDANRFRYLETI